jgi:hypothetical protein
MCGASRRSSLAHSAWKRRNPHRPAVGAEQRLDPRAHFLRGLVRERDGEHAARVGQPRADDVGNPVGDDAGLAGPRACQDENRTGGLENRVSLFRVQARDEIHSLLFYRDALGQIPG